MEERIGQQLGSYRLVHLLGQGGFADVYLGEHIHLQTLAAVKVLQMRLIGSNLEPFRNEARTIASLIHPHIVRVLDFGVENEVPFLVMEYAPRGALRQIYPKGTRLHPIHVIPYIKQIADALDYAHSKKLVHRDIKPENILLGVDGKLLLSDFGLVKAVQNTTSQTTKEMAGTIAYMAPEQINGKPRPASDQYALGVVVYEWLSGVRPFHGSLFEIATQHMVTPPHPLYGNIPSISHEVEAVIFTALAKDPQQRFPSVRDFARAFEQASRATQESDSALPTVVLPPSSCSSPFNTALMPAASELGVSQSNDILGYQQPSASLNTTPAISTLQSSTSTPVNPTQQAMQMNTPPQSAGPLPFVNSHQSQSLRPTSSNAFSSQSRQPTSMNRTSSNQPIAQEIEILQRTLVPPTAGLMGQPVQGTFPTISPSTPSFRPGSIPAVDPSMPPHHLRSNKLQWIILTLVLIILAAAGIIGYALSKGSVSAPLASIRSSLVDHRSSPGKNKAIDRLPVALPPGFAMITLTPTSKDMQNVFTITAVTGIPDSSQSQVQARQITASQSQSQTAAATGSKQIPATLAKGILTVTCHTSSPSPSPSPSLTINAGTVFTGDDNISVATDTAVTIKGCHTTIIAHAVNPGQSGNITANDVNQPYQDYTVSNKAAFHGGQDAKTMTVVTQGNIDTSTNSLESTLTPTVKQDLLEKLKANERSFGDPQCNPTVTPDQATGDEAAEVTVTVTMSCTVEAYDNDGAQIMAKKLLNNQAANNPGSDYKLMGNITTTVGQPTLMDAAHGTLSLPVATKGIWTYQWGDTQKQNLARLVAGRSAQDAKKLLVVQKGVNAVNIQLSSGSSGMLPPEISHIRIDVAPAAGLF